MFHLNIPYSDFRKETERQPVSLRRKVELPPSAVPTPEVEGVTDEEEEEYQSVILLQSMIRGRATQMMVGTSSQNRSQST